MAGGRATVDPGRPVARVLAPVIWRLGFLVAVTAAVCVLGIVASMRAVDHSVDVIAPAALLHDRVADDFEAVQASVTGWELSGVRSFRVDFARGQDDLEASLQALQAQPEDIAGLRLAVEAEVTRIRLWSTSYARARIDARGGAATSDPASFEVGRDLVEDVKAARARTSEVLASARADARATAMLRLRLTALAALLLMLLSWIVIWRARRRLQRQLAAPLLDLEQVVQRMLRNDSEHRAADDRGPKEVRAIASALNDLAGAQFRALEVEGRIRDELHVLDSAKDDFVSNVSHELRTPLTTISGYLEMVADEFAGRLEPRHDRMLEATRRNVTRLRALIDDLLALSKAEQRVGGRELADVNEMVGDAVTDVRISAARRGITVEVESPSTPMLVSSDRSMLYRAFLNILTNAVKFSHEAGSVEVRVIKVRERVEISVRDHGIGIPKAELDRLGTRFFRASNAMTNEIAGTGLGLRIVQTIIDRHAGDVVIESAEDEGTTVYVRLRLHGGTDLLEAAPLPRIAVLPA